jgi:hypothetical protein
MNHRLQIPASTPPDSRLRNTSRECCYRYRSLQGYAAQIVCLSIACNGGIQSSVQTINIINFSFQINNWLVVSTNARIVL